MDFSDCDKYIEMASQLIDRDNNIVYDQEAEGISDKEAQDDIFVVWDITNSKIVTDYELFKNSSWPDWSLSSSVNARYVN